MSKPKFGSNGRFIFGRTKYSGPIPDTDHSKEKPTKCHGSSALEFKSAADTVKFSQPIAVFPAKNPTDRKLVEGINVHLDPDAPEGSERVSIIRVFRQDAVGVPVLNSLYVKGENPDLYKRPGAEGQYEYIAHGTHPTQATALLGEVAEIPEGFSLQIDK